MDVLEMVKPVIEWATPWGRHVIRPTEVGYAAWATALAEGFCPIAVKPHRLEPFTDPETGEEWGRCQHSPSLLLFRLVYPDQIEDC